jgi:hypothetical protein
MKNITKQYQDLLEGKMSQANFMVNARREFPQWISGGNSFQDTVKILKSKRILSEGIDTSPEATKKMIDRLNKQKDKPEREEEPDQDERDADERATQSREIGMTEASDGTVEQDIKSMLARGNSYEEAIEYMAAELSMDPAELAAEYPQDVVDIEGYDDFDDDDMYNDLRADDDRINSLNEATKKSEGKYKDVTGKAEYGTFPGADHVNYNQLMKGTAFELAKMEEITDEALVKAKQKAVKNLTKDPNAYRDLITTNTKEVEKKDKTLKMQPVKKDNMVDKANGMKVIQKDVKANVQDSLGKKEKASKGNKGVKEMTQTPKKAKGIAQVMEVPGKEKILALKEHMLKEFHDMERHLRPQFSVGSRVETKDGKTMGTIVEFDQHTATVKTDEGTLMDLQPNVLKPSTAPRREAAQTAPIADTSKEDKLKAIKEKLMKAVRNEMLYKNKKTGTVQSFDSAQDKKTMTDPQFNQVFTKA